MGISEVVKDTELIHFAPIWTQQYAVYKVLILRVVAEVFERRKKKRKLV